MFGEVSPRPIQDRQFCTGRVRPPASVDDGNLASEPAAPFFLHASVDALPGSATRLPPRPARHRVRHGSARPHRRRLTPHGRKNGRPIGRPSSEMRFWEALAGTKDQRIACSTAGLSLRYCHEAQGQLRRRPARPKPARAKPTSASEPGSGTALKRKVPASYRFAGPPSTMFGKNSAVPEAP